MCFSKADGGIRCDFSPHMKRNRQRLADAENKLADIKEAISSIDKSNPQATLDGKHRRMGSLKKEGAKISESIASLKAERQEAQRHWELSSKGIAELRDKAEDPNLSLEKRQHFQALADSREQERGRILDAIVTKKLTEKNLQSIMEKDGFDQATIDECNIEISTNKYPRTSKEYKKRIHKAVNEMQALEVQRMEALRTCKHEDREAVATEYAGKLATANIDRLDAQFGYESTIEGLADLKAQAEDRSIRMKLHERLTLTKRYEKAQERHNNDKRDRNNRDNRRNAIKRAYKEAGLDATNALNAHKFVNTPVGNNKNAHYGSTALNRTIRRTVLLTASETAQVQADFRASGASSLSAYVRTKIMGDPTAYIQDKPLRKLNQEAEQFSDGEAHRQWTTRAGKRDVGNDTKLNAQEKEKLTARAKAFHMSDSSWARTRLLGLDPRQIQNDRSDDTNDIKTAMMEDRERKVA